MAREMNKRHEILYRPLGENEDTMLTQLPQGMQFLNVYTTDVTFNSNEEERDWLYLYDRTTGSLTRSPRRRWLGGEDRAIWVVCEAGPGQYVVIDDASAGMQAMADADGNQYLIDGVRPLCHRQPRRAAGRQHPADAGDPPRHGLNFV